MLVVYKLISRTHLLFQQLADNLFEQLMVHESSFAFHFEAPTVELSKEVISIASFGYLACWAYNSLLFTNVQTGPKFSFSWQS